MSTPAEVLYQYLIDEGYATVSGEWPAFVSFLPDDPSNAICVYDTTGKFDGRIMRTGEQVEHEGIQIRIRSFSYPVGWEKSNAIALALDSVRGVSVAPSSDEVYTLHNVSRSGPVIPLGVEADGDRIRYNFTVNAMLTMNQQ